MGSVLRWRRCLNSPSALQNHIVGASEIICDQVCYIERCWSGATASTSAIGQDKRAASRSIFTATEAHGSSTGCDSVAVRTCFIERHRPVSALQGFSSAAAAAATSAAPAQAPSSSGAGTLGITGSTSGSTFQAPWPWVDPGRPQILPVSVGKKERQPVPLVEAVTKLLGALAPNQRPTQNLEIFIRFRLDPRRSDHLVRGSVVLPYGTGKEIRLVVFAKGEDAEIARTEGIELIGDEELISTIVSSDGAAINFDRLIATPDFMRPLARAGKILGPKGLMPNPKMGTLTTDVAGAIRDIRRGRLDYRMSREATVRAVLGRCSMTADQLAANVGALVASLIENRPKVLAGPGSPGVAAGPGGGATAGGPAGAGAPQAGATAATVGLLERYFMTFLLKTNHSPSVHISFDSLIEAATKHQPAASTGASQQRKAG